MDAGTFYKKDHSQIQVKRQLTSAMGLGIAQGLDQIRPLGFAVEKGHKEIVELLIAKDADVNAKMEDGDTPLDWAIEINRTETADLLRKHGGKTGEELKAEGN